MTSARMIAILAVSLLFCGGCAVERHYGLKPGQDQVIEVASGDRWPFSLPDSSDGEWDYECDDDDVEVTIDSNGRKSSVVIRVHRGYDGPSEVKFFRRGHDGKKKGLFVVTLYKRTGDEAFWK